MQDLETRIQRPDVVRAYEKLNRTCGTGTRHIFAAVYNDQRAQLAGFVVHGDERCCRREQRSSEEHGHARDRGEPTVPERQRQDDQRGAGNPQQNTERGPGTLIPAQVQNLGHQQNNGEKRADSDFLQARSEVFCL